MTDQQLSNFHQTDRGIKYDMGLRLSKSPPSLSIGSKSSIWSLPAVVAASLVPDLSTSGSGDSMASDHMAPDSTTGEHYTPLRAGSPRSVLSPSRLGFLTFDSSPGRSVVYIDQIFCFLYHIYCFDAAIFDVVDLAFAAKITTEQKMFCYLWKVLVLIS